MPEITPTPWFCAVYGANPTLDGVPIPSGSILRAYDPNGVLCGVALMVHVSNVIIDKKPFTGVIYKFSPIYGDDYTTPNVDEGANEGDTIRFTLYMDGTLVNVAPDPPLLWRHQTLVRIEEWHSVGYETGDVNYSGSVDIADLNVMVTSFFQTGELLSQKLADLNKDDSVDIADLQALVQRLFPS